MLSQMYERYLCQTFMWHHSIIILCMDIVVLEMDTLAKVVTFKNGTEFFAWGVRRAEGRARGESTWVAERWGGVEAGREESEVWSEKGGEAEEIEGYGGQVWLEGGNEAQRRMREESMGEGAAMTAMASLIDSN